MSLFRSIIAACLLLTVVSEEILITLASGETQTINTSPGTYTNFKLAVENAVPGVFVVELGGVRNECTSVGAGCTMTWTGSLWLPATMTNTGVLPLTGTLYFDVDIRARSIAWIVGITTVLGVLGLACLCVGITRRMTSRRDDTATGILIASPPPQYYGTTHPQTQIPHVEGVPVTAPTAQDSFTTVQISQN